MTMLLVMEALDSGAISPDDMVTVSANAAGMGGSQVYLKQGDAFRPEWYLRSVRFSEELALSASELEENSVRMEGNVDTSVPGTYMVTYRYAYEGTTALAVLTVVVE